MREWSWKHVDGIQAPRIGLHHPLSFHLKFAQLFSASNIDRTDFNCRDFLSRPLKTRIQVQVDALETEQKFVGEITIFFGWKHFDFWDKLKLAQ